MPRFSTDTYANAPGTLGICNIEDPVYNETASTYNRVYFGYVPESPTGHAVNSDGSDVADPYGGLKGKALYWRVLNITANGKKSPNATSYEPALFMLTEYALGSDISWDMRSSGYKQCWKRTDGTTDSSLRMFLQGSSCNATLSHDAIPYTGSGVYDECFDPAEQEALLTTYNSEDTQTYEGANWSNSRKGTVIWIKSKDEENRYYGYGLGCGLTGDKIFLLSAKEVTERKYGFNDSEELELVDNWYRRPEDPNRIVKCSDNSESNKGWWLRSAYSSNDYDVACVYSSGYSGNGSSYYTGVAVRFALNIPLSSVLFAQDAKSTVSTPSSIFTAIETSSLDDTRSTDPSLGLGAKLTIVDKRDTSPRCNFWIPQGKYKVPRASSAPTNITIPYRHAATGSGEYISAIIKESDDATSYYARLKLVSNPVDANGTVTMTIPADLPQGNYKLIVMNEKDNGPYRTNYAKNYNLRLTVNENNVTVSEDGAAGVCTIENPEFKADGSVYNRVYFGYVPEETTGIAKNYDDNTIIDVQDPYGNMKGNALYWRVLNTTANDKASTPALFMLTEYTLGSNISWDMRISENNQRWEYIDPTTNTKKTDSSLRMFLQGNSCNATLSHNGTPYTGSGVYDECFDPIEQKAMLETYNGEITQTASNYNPNSSDNIKWIRNTDDSDSYALGCGLTGDKLFLLSGKEVTEEKYGFEGSREYNYTYSSRERIGKDPNRTTKYANTTGNTCDWWLRSAYSSSSAIARIAYSGFVSYDSSRRTVTAVRFALNIPLSSILFTQDTNSTASISSPTFTAIPSTLTRTKFIYNKNDASVPLQIYTVEDNYDDEPYTASTPPGAKLTIVDDSSKFAITQDIARATAGQSISVNYTNASVGTNEYISAIIKDIFGDALYHAKLKSVDKSNGTISMDIPSNLSSGEYMLVIYNESERGSYNTNYAGYDTLILVVLDKNNPDKDIPTITNVYTNPAGTSFKFTATDDVALYQATNSGGRKLRDLAGRNITTNMIDIGTQGTIVVEDLAGRFSIEPQNILTDRTPPTVKISYNDGKYTLTVSDNESGVWKITNHDGTVVYRDYSC